LIYLGLAAYGKLAFKAPPAVCSDAFNGQAHWLNQSFAKNGKFSYDLGFLLPIDRSSQKWAYRLCGNVDSAHQRKPLFVKDASVEIFDDPISALDPMQSPLPLSKGQLSPITDAAGRAINACKHYNKPHHFPRSLSANIRPDSYPSHSPSQ
jgi:hypothetical protein